MPRQNKKSRQRIVTAQSSGVRTRNEIVKSIHPSATDEVIEQSLARLRDAVPKAMRPKVERSARVDPRINRHRDYTDRLDDVEVELARHGLSMEDLEKHAKQYESGARTPYSTICHAILSWWCSRPVGQIQVLWIDPDAGYTTRNLPKLSSFKGQELVRRGLVGAVRVMSRKHLLEARAWRRRMLSLTPTERLKEPVMLGDARVTMGR